jgi:hypothetical protein
VLPWCQDWLRKHSPPVIPPPPSFCVNNNTNPRTDGNGGRVRGEDPSFFSSSLEDHDEDPLEMTATPESVFLSLFKQCSGLLVDLVAGYLKISACGASTSSEYFLTFIGKNLL